MGAVHPLTPLRSGTASRLGIRKPCPCQAIPQRIILGPDMSDDELARWSEALDSLPSRSYFSLSVPEPNIVTMPFHYEGECELPRLISS